MVGEWRGTEWEQHGNGMVCVSPPLQPLLVPLLLHGVRDDVCTNKVARLKLVLKMRHFIFRRVVEFLLG
jgi:hypothetical protein